MHAHLNRYLVCCNPLNTYEQLTLGTNDGMVFSYVAVIGPALVGQLRNLHRLSVCCATCMPAQLIFTETSPSVTLAPASRHNVMHCLSGSRADASMLCIHFIQFSRIATASLQACTVHCCCAEFAPAGQQPVFAASASAEQLLIRPFGLKATWM